MNYRAVIFDLDGTLLDTVDDLADSMNAALKHWGFPEHTASDYKRLIGNGLRNLAEVSLPGPNRDDETIDCCLSYMRAEYEKRWSEKTRPYPGIPELLDELARRQIKMAVLSNKAHTFTRKIIETLLPDWKFDAVFGERLSIPRKPDPQTSFEIAGLLDIPVEEFIFLGDSGVDMKTAHAAGMLPVGALWGFRPMEELKENGAKFLISKPLELLKLPGEIGNVE
ncbi:MAG TPA: HAD family hydrolase [Anaerovoracaceae bacterium]|nr:HAD family hydrolase [Anaerovoracaceae bacterium]